MSVDVRECWYCRYADFGWEKALRMTWGADAIPIRSFARKSGDSMNDEKRKPIRSPIFIRFNAALDTDRKLQDGMKGLAGQYDCLTEREYTEKTLELCRQAGFTLTDVELRQLLKQRLQLATDRLLCKNQI